MNELETILEKAVVKGATDLHICGGIEPRIRIDNNLLPLKDSPFISPEKTLECIFSKFSDGEKNKFYERIKRFEEVDCSFSTTSNARVRANIFKSENGVQLALRIIPNSRLKASEIGIPFPVTDICKRKSGLFIVTGANGSGKTSTIAAMIDIINESRNLHILTIEDPVEYLIKSRASLVSQREIGRDSPTFYSALRSAVRENPDIIVLGEMRDIETTRTAIELSETGHLVFATLHTRTSISAIDRLVGQFSAGEQPQIRLMISENLLGVLSQTLLRRKRGGMIAAFEFLSTTPAVRNLIREQKIPQILSVLQTGSALGMCTMEDSILNLVERDIVAAEEAMAHAFRPQELLEMMRKSPKIPNGALAGLR